MGFHFRRLSFGHKWTGFYPKREPNTVAELVSEGVLHENPWYWDPDRIYNQDPSAYLVTDIGNGYVYVNEHKDSPNFITVMVPFADNLATTNYPTAPMRLRTRHFRKSLSSAQGLAAERSSLPKWRLVRS